MTDAQKECFEKLFHVAYSVGKRRRPYTDLMDIIELANFHNVKFFPGGSYENESACRDFVNTCASLIFNEEVKEKLLKSNFIGILCGGFTDSSVIEKVYLRSVCWTLFHENKCCFLMIARFIFSGCNRYIRSY